MDRQNRKRHADTQEAAWVAEEDKFVLQQAKKKAAIRVKEGRAKAIDWLAVTLRFTDSARSAFDDEVEDGELDIVDPQSVFEDLDGDQLAELEKDIDIYASLESNSTNGDFWSTMAIICRDRRKLEAPKGRSQDTVTSDVDKLFSSKSLPELEKLETQIRTKLRSDEPIDIEYWENLLHTLTSWKAKAKLRTVSQSIVDSQLEGLRRQQADEATRLASRLSNAISNSSQSFMEASQANGQNLDPQSLLQVRAEDSKLPVQDEEAFLKDTVSLGCCRLEKGREAYHPTDTGTTESTKTWLCPNEEAAAAKWSI